jgi:hypothetical protein
MTRSTVASTTASAWAHCGRSSARTHVYLLLRRRPLPALPPRDEAIVQLCVLCASVGEIYVACIYFFLLLSDYPYDYFFFLILAV